MTFDEILSSVLAQLENERRIAYRTLQRRFALSAKDIEDIKTELIDAKQIATDENGRVLVWVGQTQIQESASDHPPDVERRQLTVMFCDLVGSTPLAERLDPEDLHEVIRAYHKVCATTMGRWEGYIARYVGDGVVIYFGYPHAYEDDALRAVRSALALLEALPQLNTRLLASLPVMRDIPIRMRIGIHTGLVVIGEVGRQASLEHLALGETPNIAARLHEISAPNTVVISAATSQLIEGFFQWRSLGAHPLKGISVPVSIYQVLDETHAQNRFDVAVARGLTPLVGREDEVRQITACWEQASRGVGHVLCLEGEAGIGKSRLVQALKEHVGQAEQNGQSPSVQLECRCSAYYQNSAFYPVIDLVQQLLAFDRQDTTQEQIQKIEQTLKQHGFALQETVPLLAAFLSVPLPEGYSATSVTPQRQKQQTQELLRALLGKIAAASPQLLIIEDLHWADPSTLELLTYLFEDSAAAPILYVLTFRPDFSPHWDNGHNQTVLSLGRMETGSTQTLVRHVTKGKALPQAVMQQIVDKTDGIPLFVEELTKTVIESGWLRPTPDGYEITETQPDFTIPATLQDSLTERLDRLRGVKEIAQLGATLGRDFSLELIDAVSPLDTATLQKGLNELVATELLYQVSEPTAPPRYVFKHALVQDTAYNSLLKRSRQKLHKQIAEIIESQFTDILATQPEFLAHHYTEAGLPESAIPFWQKAGQRANDRAAYTEAIMDLSKALRLLAPMSESPDRDQQELALQVALGLSLSSTKGYAAPEVEQTYSRARELCQHLGETADIFPVLRGLCTFYMVRGNQTIAHDLAEQCLRLARLTQNTAFLIEGYTALGYTLCYRGELDSSRVTLEQGLQHYFSSQDQALTFLTPQDPGVACLSMLSFVLWLLGYPDQALRRSQEALALAQGTGQPFNIAYAHTYRAMVCQQRCEPEEAANQAHATINISTEHEIGLWQSAGKMFLGLAESTRSGATPEMVRGMTHALSDYRAGGAELMCPYYLTWIAEAHRSAGQLDEASAVLAEALECLEQNGEQVYKAAIYRLRGELTLARSGSAEEAESDFVHAVEIARSQRAKSLELQAVVSLSRLWQQQGKKEQACQQLAEVYTWFTEGLDTDNLQEAHALLRELSEKKFGA